VVHYDDPHLTKCLIKFEVGPDDDERLIEAGKYENLKTFSQLILFMIQIIY